MHLIQGLKYQWEVKMVASKHMNRHGLLVEGGFVKNCESGFPNLLFVFLQFY